MIIDIPKGFVATLQAVDKFNVDELKPREELLITGNGTALYSAMMGSQVLDLTAQAWQAVPAFEFTNYGRQSRTKSSLMIGVSHSGITKSTLDALSKESTFGSATVGLTHFADRPISKVADKTVVIGDSPDRSRCHTKAYTDSAAAVFALSLALATPAENEDEIADIRAHFETKLVDEIQSTISNTEALAKKAASELRDFSKIYFAGAGPNSVTAREAALKIKESSYLAAEGMELEEMLHGPAMSFNDKTLVVAIAPSGPSDGRTKDLLAAAKRIGAKTMVVSDLSEFDANYDFRFSEVHEYLSPFLTIIPLYLFAYYFAVENGKNPDYIHYTDQTYWDARTIIFPPGTH
jgi:glutamine---fructose-6-phosphate transaminase (isomerizing)